MINGTKYVRYQKYYEDLDQRKSFYGKTTKEIKDKIKAFEVANHCLTDTPTAKARWVLEYNNFQIYSKAYKTNYFLQDFHYQAIH